MDLQDLSRVHSGRDAERVEDDVDRGAVLQERHVLDRQDLRDDALVAVTAGELVTVGDLALLGDVDADQLVHARGKLVALLAVEDAHADDLADLAVGHLQGGVADLAGLLAEDRAEQALLRGQLGLALRRDLADQDVAGDDFGTDADDAALVEVGEDLLGDVRDVPGDLLGAQLGVTGVDLVLLDVDRGEDVVLHEALRQDDRVLVVVALPRHERHEQVLAERHLAVFGGGAVGEDLALDDAVALVHDDLLVHRGALVRAGELVQAVRDVRAVVVGDRDVVGRQLLDDAVLLGLEHVAGVGGAAVLHAGADERGLRLNQRHRLTHHVRAHEGAVGVVVLQEGDHGGRDRHHLARRDVHVVHVRRLDVVDLAAALADQDAVLGEAQLVVERGVGLRDDEAVLLVGGDVVDLVGDLAVDDLAVRRLDEAERVDAAVRGERTDQTDVRAFGGLDRAHASVVGRVHVSDLEAGPLTGQTAGTERREATLVRQTRQRVVLVHELRQLAGAEELLDGGDDRPDVDQGLRRDRLDVLGGHALAHDALHTGETRTDLVLDQLADVAQAAVAEVVDVVGLDDDLVAVLTDRLGLARVELHEVLDRGDDVVGGEDAGVQRLVRAELLVHLVAADLREVVALRVEVEVLEQRLGGLAGRRLARAELAVDVEQRVVLALGVVLLQGGAHGLVLAELLEDLLGGPAEGLQEDGDGLLALAVDADADQVALVDLHLQPGTPGRDDLGGEDVLVGRLVDRGVEVDARGADELRHDDTLGAVDDEGALVGHEREVAHEDRLGLDLAGLVVGELGGDEERGAVREVTVLALVDRVLRRLEAVVAEGQRHRPGEVLDRGDLLEDLLQAGLRGDVLSRLKGSLDASLPGGVAEQPVKALGLQREEVRNLEGLLDLCKGDAQRGGACAVVRIGRGVARGGQEGVLPRARTHYARTGPQQSFRADVS